MALSTLAAMMMETTVLFVIRKKSFNWDKSLIKSNGSILVNKLSMKLVLAVWEKLEAALLPLL